MSHFVADLYFPPPQPPHRNTVRLNLAPHPFPLKRGSPAFEICKSLLKNPPCSGLLTGFGGPQPRGSGYKASPDHLLHPNFGPISQSLSCLPRLLMIRPGGSGRGADPRPPRRAIPGQIPQRRAGGWLAPQLGAVAPPRAFSATLCKPGVGHRGGKLEPAHHLHPVPSPPGRVGLSNWKASQATHVVGSLKPPVVSNVLPQRLAAIELLPIDLVLAVLLLHTGCVIPEGCQ